MGWLEYVYIFLKWNFGRWKFSWRWNNSVEYVFHGNFWIMNFTILLCYQTICCSPMLSYYLIYYYILLFYKLQECQLSILLLLAAFPLLLFILVTYRSSIFLVLCSSQSTGCQPLICLFEGSFARLSLWRRWLWDTSGATTSTNDTTTTSSHTLEDWEELRNIRDPLLTVWWPGLSCQLLLVIGVHPIDIQLTYVDRLQVCAGTCKNQFRPLSITSDVPSDISQKSLGDRTYKTQSGLPYYHNSKTGQTVWEALQHLISPVTLKTTRIVWSLGSISVQNDGIP